MTRAGDIQSSRDLIAWQKAMDLVCSVYEWTRALPADERFGLIAQMRRCAASVPANIAEGWGRDTKGDYLHFLHVALGSTLELNTHAEICIRLGYSGDWSSVVTQCDEQARILRGLIRSITASAKTRRSERDVDAD